MPSLIDILEFNTENFHFLRAHWLWLELGLLLILGLVILSSREKSKWKEIIPLHLRRYMFTQPNTNGMVLPTTFYAIAMAIGIFALAGPTWKRIEVPGMKSTASLVILLDLSWSMMAQDLEPNRLERAKLKVRDLLDANPRARTALTVYAGTTHPVMTLTNDYRMIKHHVDELKTGIMPVRGNNLTIAMEMMDSVFQRFDAPSTLLLVTDNVAASDVDLLLDFVNSTPHRIEVLPMTTTSGAPVPGFRKNTVMKDASGNNVTSVPDLEAFRQLSGHDRITVNQLTLDKSDIEGIAERVRRDLVFQLEETESDEEWQDEGLLFLIPVVFFAIFFFRKGWMIQWCLAGCIISLTSCAPESKYARLWYSADYHGQLFEDEKEYTRAAETYASLDKKAVAYFKAGDFEAAASLLAMDSTASGQYNLGLALANNGNYDGAKEAFSNALRLDPTLAVAQSGMDSVNVAIEQAASVQRFNPAEAAKDENEGNLVERKAKGKDEELTSDTEVDELPKDGERVTDEVATETRTAKEMDFPPDSIDMGRPEEAQNILLRGISPDPSEFLRRRFLFQQRKYYPNIKEGGQKW